MAAMRLTPANLDHVKHQLRQDFPEIGSAHRTEAFAVACGFRTFASLLAAMRDREGKSALVAVDGDRWSARLAELGYDNPPRDSLIASLRSHQLPDLCWVMFPSRQRAPGEHWFGYCKRANIPYVTVEMERKYATLAWDCISLDTACDQNLRDDPSRKIVDQLFATFQRRSAGSGAKPYFFGSAFVGSIEGLRPDIAQTLADDFFAILFRASRSALLAAA